MDQPETWNELRRIVNESNKIVFFGGAGVSTESNIPDFRSASGLYKASGSTSEEAWAAYAPEEILSRSFFVKNPSLFYDFYFNKMIYSDAKPNPAHHALAAWEDEGRLTAVVTQNIDGLHQMAGSRQVIELHGSVHRNYCTGCGISYTLEDMLSAAPAVPYCRACRAVIRPDVVLYGEQLPEGAVNAALEYISRADVLIVGGTSLSVYPAAGLIRYFKGAALVLINRDETPYDRAAHLVIREPIGRVLSSVAHT